MQVVIKHLNDTKVQLNLTADAEMLQAVKKEVLGQLAKTMRIQGFRPGKAPLHMVEKNADATALQTEFLDRAMNQLYVAALRQENLRAVAQPEVKITKFVPFDSLELEAEVAVVGAVKLPDYKKLKVAKKEAKVAAKDVDDVITNLRGRMAEKKDVDRAAKDGDCAWIDFTGVDGKTKEPIDGADGKDYPLTLGSNSFIPGFEENVVGMKSNDEKSFTLTFPADYGVADLQNRKVTFTVTVSKVQAVSEPKVDDAFAAKIGPFKTVTELKADIKKQLTAEKESQTEREYTDDVLSKITEKSTVAIPPILIDEQVERTLDEQRQNAVYSGQTWEEFLKAEGTDEEALRTKLRPQAELRVKAGLVLAEIAEIEKVNVSSEELDVRMQLLKGQYQDPQMQAELEKPETRRDIHSRMLTEKTLATLADYASAK
jgi:trigger factor